jgi:hypothetical protein
LAGLELYNASTAAWNIVNVGTAAANTLEMRNASNVAMMSVTQAGAWTFGPSSGSSLTHTVQSGASTTLAIQGLDSGSASSLLFKHTSVNRFSLYSDSVSNLKFYSYGTAASDIASATQAGTWTFGPSTNTALHIFQGRLNVQGNSASAGGGIASNNSKFLINGDSASTASAATFHLGDNNSGTSRQWALVNGRNATAQSTGTLSFICANAANTDPFNGSGTAPLILSSAGIFLATSGGTATALNYYEEGSFTGSATGFTTTPAPIIYFTRVGKQVTLNISSFSATSNSVNFTITGLPARLSPTREINQLCIVSDNAAFQTTPGYCNITAGGTTLTFYRNTAGNNFTSSGTKGLTFTTITYQLA